MYFSHHFVKMRQKGENAYSRDLLMKQGQILNCLFCLGRTKETIWAAKKHMRQKSNDSQRKVRLKRTSQSRPHLSNLPIFCCPFLDSSACRKWTHHFDVLAHTSQHSTSLLSLISSLSKRNRPDCSETLVVQDRLKALVEGLYHCGISVELGRVIPETADWQNYH